MEVQHYYDQLYISHRIRFDVTKILIVNFYDNAELQIIDSNWLCQNRKWVLPKDSVIEFCLCNLHYRYHAHRRRVKLTCKINSGFYLQRITTPRHPDTTNCYIIYRTHAAENTSVISLQNLSTAQLLVGNLPVSQLEILDHTQLNLKRILHFRPKYSINTSIDSAYLGKALCNCTCTPGEITTAL